MKITGKRHTPGPWIPQRRYGRCLVYAVNYPEGRICEFRPQDLGFNDQEANACLIAAAPDLLAALKICIASEALRWDGVPEDEWPDFLREAIKAVDKAEGVEF